MKLKYGPEEYYREEKFGWVAHPNGGDQTSEVDQLLVENRQKIEIIGGVEDETLSYEYDEWALCKLKGKYYLLSTSGCSCPSPSETWRVEIGPTSLAAIKKHVLSGNYDGYTLPKKQEQDFLDLIAKAEKA